MTKRLDEQGKGRGRLTAAWVIEMITRERRTPVLQDANETAVRDESRRLILHHTGQPMPGHCGMENHLDIVRSELPLDAHAQFSSRLGELPSVHAARRRQTEIDAFMLGEVLRR